MAERAFKEKSEDGQNRIKQEQNMVRTFTSTHPVYYNRTIYIPFEYRNMELVTIHDGRKFPIRLKFEFVGKTEELNFECRLI